MPIQMSDFSGVLTVAAPSATATNNVAGKFITVQSLSYLSLGPIAVGGTTAQNDLIAAVPLFPFSPKVMRGVLKTASQAWVVGQAIYLIVATGAYTTAGVSSGVVLAGIVATAAASADVVGDIIPATPF